MSYLHENEELRKLTLSEFLDGDLDASKEREVVAHVENCSECNDYLNSLKLVSSSLEIFLDEASPPMPENFSERVRAAAESDISDIRTGRERIWGLGISAVLLVIVAIAVSSNFGYSNSYIQSALSLPIAAFEFVAEAIHKVSVTISVVFGAVIDHYLFRSSFSVFLVVGITVFSILVFSKHLRGFKRS